MTSLRASLPPAGSVNWSRRISRAGKDIPAIKTLYMDAETGCGLSLSSYLLTSLHLHLCCWALPPHHRRRPCLTGAQSPTCCYPRRCAAAVAQTSHGKSALHIISSLFLTPDSCKYLLCIFKRLGIFYNCKTLVKHA